MTDSDALVIGAGPAGAAAAILLAQAGWRVVLVEQHRYPRQKVCGECVGAGNLALIDRLGIGLEFRRLAGAQLRQVGWMSAEATILADLPACADGRYRHGRALGRDQFDSLLLERARSVGVRVLQPAKVRTVRGKAGAFLCAIDEFSGAARRTGGAFKASSVLSASLVIDAHGSWEPGPRFAIEGEPEARRAPSRASDLFAFKATFTHSTLAPGLLPVLSLHGGYGGMVVADGARTTIACCLRRDALQSLRVLNRGATAGIAVEGYLRRSCRGVRDTLSEARRVGSWLSVGPLRPGIRLQAPAGVFRVGNAAGESHPLIGEGISMALQSASLLVNCLLARGAGKFDSRCAAGVNRAYARAWRGAFAPRLRIAALYAQIAMRPALAAPLRAMLRRWPTLLNVAARCAGKARPSIELQSLIEETS